MLLNRPRTRTALLHAAAIALFASLLCAPARLLAQDTNQYEAEKRRAVALLESGKATEALPLLEKLAETNENDGQLMFYLGFAVLANSQTSTEPAARKQARLRTRAAMLRAKELGFTNPVMESILEQIPADGGDEQRYSQNSEADAAMRTGEAAFAQGKLNDALAAYQRALQFDPKLYAAALFAGDMYFKTNRFAEAADWYAKAVAIDPDRETAYRYAASPLMEQGKLAEARAKYIEAVIAEPYNRLAWAGLQRWAEAAHVTLAQPKIEPLSSVTPMKDNHMTVTIDPKAMGKDDGTAAWMMYGITRAAWTTNNNERFRKQYPGEQSYRHSLAEEATALRMVAEHVQQQTKDGKIKRLDPALAQLVKLNDAGLLEAYILLAHADEGIAHDYAAYRKTNSDKLRRYLSEYVTANKQ